MVKKFRTEMTGMIESIAHNVGDKVHEDDTVVVISAMKMEMPMVAPVSGIVISIEVAVGQVVNNSDVLFSIES